MGKKIMIVGANFADKGSQARLFVLIDELKKRLSDCEVYYAHNDEQLDDALYRFKKFSYTKKEQAQVLKSNPLGGLTKLFKKKDESASGEDLTGIISQMDLMIDISDHVLVDTSSLDDIEYYMNNIRIARKFKIPMVIMPQSFGPFDFDMDSMHVLGELKDLLFYPKVIFTREQDGYNELIGYFGLDNMRNATDMLLLKNDFDLSNVSTRFYRPEVPEIPTSNNVAIVPCALAFDKKYRDKTMDMYKKLFEVLNMAKKNVYIMSQNTADQEACKTLASEFRNFSNVNFIESELDCVQTNMLISSFEIVISSHYSTCVESYRHFIPVLLLGTGAKYRELAELFGQEKLNFDILSEECNNFDVADALTDLCNDIDLAKTRVQTRTLNIQGDTCFAIFDELGWPRVATEEEPVDQGAEVVF